MAESRSVWHFRENPLRKELLSLEAYLDFLEDIDAFKSRKVKTKFYEAEFDL